ncbi:hypothetical protein ACHQM5_027568 [Ranunculus cassubicifolius]
MVTIPATAAELNYNRVEELKAFDDTKTGVKGLVDSGIQKVPKIFIRQSNELNQKSDFLIPVIDLQGERHEVIEEIKFASEKWGFFQVVNHGVPLGVLDEMIKGMHRFNEQDELKKDYYSRDPSKRVRFVSNYDLYKSKAANWRDTLTIQIRTPAQLNPKEIPSVCRDIAVEYTNYTTALGDSLFELLSEALGLSPNHLKQMNCSETCIVNSNYYPACPEPDLTLGITGHTDPAFLTILLQDHIGGLQVLHQEQWVDVNPIPGALVINIGDLLQILSNDKLKSVEHRVLSKKVGPRVSVACFLTTRFDVDTKPYGPMKELISEDSGAVYREISNKEYIENFFNQGVEGK